MGDSWLIPLIFDIAISSNPSLPSSIRNHPGITHCFLLPISSNPAQGQLQSCPCPALPSSNNSRRKHPLLTIKLELGTHTKQATFLGSTHG